MCNFMIENKKRMSQFQTSPKRHELAPIYLLRNIPVKSLTTIFVLSVLLTACAGSQVIPPGMLEGSTGMSSSLRTEQEIPKSNGDTVAQSSPANSSSEVENGEAASNDPGPAPEKPVQEIDNAPTAFVAPPDPPTTIPTEVAAEPPAPPPVDLSISVGCRIGNRAPDFALQTLDGSTIALSDLLGQPLLINYWATWCVPCKAELPILERLFQEYQSRGLMIVSVDAIEQDTPDKLQSVITQIGMTFPTLLDEGNQFADAYQAIFFPTSFFIDTGGVIRDITLGDSSEEIFRQKIEMLLSGEF
jgi:peroxiredoxin